MGNRGWYARAHPSVPPVSQVLRQRQDRSRWRPGCRHDTRVWRAEGEWEWLRLAHRATLPWTPPPPPRHRPLPPRPPRHTTRRQQSLCRHQHHRGVCAWRPRPSIPVNHGNAPCHEVGGCLCRGRAPRRLQRLLATTERGHRASHGQHQHHHHSHGGNPRNPLRRWHAQRRSDAEAHNTKHAAPLLLCCLKQLQSTGTIQTRGARNSRWHRSAWQAV